MKSSRSRLATAVVAVAALVPLAACSSSSGSGDASGKTEITLLTDNAQATVKPREGGHRRVREGQPDDHRQDRDPAGRLGR